MQSYLQLAYQLATRISTCNSQLAYQLATRNSQSDSQLATSNSHDQHISHTLSVLPFAEFPSKSLFRKMMVCILVRVPQSTPYGAPWGVPQVLQLPIFLFLVICRTIKCGLSNFKPTTAGFLNHLSGGGGGLTGPHPKNQTYHQSI